MDVVPSEQSQASRMNKMKRRVLLLYRICVFNVFLPLFEFILDISVPSVNSSLVNVCGF